MAYVKELECIDPLQSSIIIWGGQEEQGAIAKYQGVRDFIKILINNLLQVLNHGPF